MASRVPRRRVALGRRAIAGVEALGTRFRATLPAGTFAHPEPIQKSNERWVSPALRLVVYSRIEDSAIGVVEYRVTRFDANEPPAELFAIQEAWRPAAGPVGFKSDNPYVLLARSR